MELKSKYFLYFSMYFVFLMFTKHLNVYVSVTYIKGKHS